jgi:putative DNA-invertase from lambdoid prophage Rac
MGLSTPHGRMLATVLAGVAEFERELIRERVRFGMAAAFGARSLG